MEYADRSGGQSWADNLDVRQHYVTEMNVFGAIGGFKELQYDHARPELGYHEAVKGFRVLGSMPPMPLMPNYENYCDVDIQSLAKEWQSSTTNTKPKNADWQHTGGPYLMLSTEADGCNSTPCDRLVASHHGKRSCLGPRLRGGSRDPVASQELMEDKSMLQLHTTSHSQPPPSQRRLGDSAKFVPRRLSGRSTDYAATSAEITVGVYRNDFLK
ncbi:hypothetical protein G6011_10025 [Alternaria panax]|uniref:Uncharacterized protein n=1 Tax=Alternaria panax TaxID=48097 RepID=A0AAD4FBW4_9PLEO|nr:hypothetical protein G6011_10025 [Alternaria panax]